MCSKNVINCLRIKIRPKGFAIVRIISTIESLFCAIIDYRNANYNFFYYYWFT